MRVVVEGCCHGELDAIYREIGARYGDDVDLVLIAGDFQAVRSKRDLESMAVPPKFKQLGDFPRYYWGEKKAPYLTVFIGGNHEASAHMNEIKYGGWAAPNIYYLGTCGVINVNGLRIAGLSGIYNEHHYNSPKYETVPYDHSTMRSVYHIRRTDVDKLCLLSSPIDVVMSHDWPRGIWKFGDNSEINRYKKHLVADIKNGTLGSPGATQILEQLKPNHWFSAHLHVRFQAFVNHEPRATTGAKPTRDQTSNATVLPSDQADPNEIDLEVGSTVLSDPNEIDLDLATSPKQAASNDPSDPNEIDLVFDNHNHDEPTPDITTSAGAAVTHFLALDKCLPKRKFLELVEISPAAPTKKRPTDSENPLQPRIEYDKEWLAILRASLVNANKIPTRNQIDESANWISTNAQNLEIPFNFETARPTPNAVENNQTRDLFLLLGVTL